MKGFYLGAVLSFILATLGWLVGLYAQLGAPTPTSRWVLEAYRKKSEIAATTPSPRILIVAGSSALFGLDSAALSQAWRIPTVNMSVNAGLGLRYILWRARLTARPGDTILLPLEYALFVDEDRPNAQIIDYTIARDQAYWNDLSIWRKMTFALALSPDRWWQGLRSNRDLPILVGLYGAHNIDERGDQTHTSLSDRNAAEAEELASAPVWRYGARAKTLQGGWAELKAFGRWAQATDVCVVALPPSLLMKLEYANDLTERQFYETLPSRVAKLGVPYFGQPIDFMYPSNWFFNTDYHLQDWARAEHTRRVLAIPGLSAAVHCQKPKKVG